ncbi:hypothetical protein DIPPA_34531 [Diplonema papillatum]|nr:hypothetical protein DIPPA_34531 [Diplonema papillatum]
MRTVPLLALRGAVPAPFATASTGYCVLTMPSDITSRAQISKAFEDRKADPVHLPNFVSRLKAEGYPLESKSAGLAMSIAADSRNQRLCRDLHVRLQELNVVPTVQMYKALLKVHANSWRQAAHFRDEMKRKGVAPSVLCAVQLLRAVRYRRDLDAAEKLALACRLLREDGFRAGGEARDAAAVEHARTYGRALFPDAAAAVAAVVRMADVRDRQTMHPDPNAGGTPQDLLDTVVSREKNECKKTAVAQTTTSTDHRKTSRLSSSLETSTNNNDSRDPLDEETILSSLVSLGSNLESAVAILAGELASSAPGGGTPAVPAFRPLFVSLMGACRKRKDYRAACNIAAVMERVGIQLHPDDHALLIGCTGVSDGFVELTEDSILRRQEGVVADGSAGAAQAGVGGAVSAGGRRRALPEEEEEELPWLACISAVAGAGDGRPQATHSARSSTVSDDSDGQPPATIRPSESPGTHAACSPTVSDASDNQPQTTPSACSFTVSSANDGQPQPTVLPASSTATDPGCRHAISDGSGVISAEGQQTAPSENLPPWLASAEADDQSQSEAAGSAPVFGPHVACEVRAWRRMQKRVAKPAIAVEAYRAFLAVCRPENLREAEKVFADAFAAGHHWYNSLWLTLLRFYFRAGAFDRYLLAYARMLLFHVRPSREAQGHRQIVLSLQRQSLADASRVQKKLGASLSWAELQADEQCEDLYWKYGDARAPTQAVFKVL